MPRSALSHKNRLVHDRRFRGGGKGAAGGGVLVASGLTGRPSLRPCLNKSSAVFTSAGDQALGEPLGAVVVVADATGEMAPTSYSCSASTSIDNITLSTHFWAWGSKRYVAFRYHSDTSSWLSRCHQDAWTGCCRIARSRGWSYRW